MIPEFYFCPLKLKDLAARYRQTFLTANPFQHVVIDNFLPEDILNVIVDEFPTPDQITWDRGVNRKKIINTVAKLGTSTETKFGPFTRHFMSQLNSITLIHFLESLTNVKDLIPDPAFSGCGLHSTGRGGRLMVHADSSRHRLKRLHQRFNLILFINKDWKEEFGGAPRTLEQTPNPV